MASQIDKLYETDFYAWTKDQAAALRRLADERWNGPLDLAHLAEEVEDLGDERLNAVRSQMRRIIEHCLKLEYSPAKDPRLGWRISVEDARDEIEDRLTGTIRQDIEARLPRLYAQALRKARLGLAAQAEAEAARALPAENPYALDDLLTEAWYPVNRYGLIDED
jgi:hypothetical protein